jgi:hypothetical protein
MKKFRTGALVWAALILFACRNGSNPASAVTSHSKDTAVKKNFFPVRDFLKSEIAYVDSFPSKMVEYRIRDGKTDSFIIKIREFDRLAATFILDDLDSNRFEQRFDETSFMDQTTSLLTFTYSTKDSSFGLRRVDVLAEPHTGNDQVKSIYLEVSSGNEDSLVLQKMYWRSRKSFSIIRIYQPRNGEASTSQTKVVWDSSE